MESEDLGVNDDSGGNGDFPVPSYDPSPDPFAPDPTIFPPPPPWLFPAVMVLLAIGVLVVLILLYAWYKSIQVAKVEREALPKKDWVDLSQLGIRGRWEDEGDRPSSRNRARSDADPPDGAGDDRDDPDDPDGLAGARN
jgi:hypothetical protein